MGKGLLKLGKGVKAGVIDQAVLNDVFRNAHTLKGMCGIYDLKDMASLAHSLEDTLDLLRFGRMILSYELLDIVMDTHDLLSCMVNAGARGGYSSEARSMKLRLEEASRDPVEMVTGELLDESLSSQLSEYESHRFRENVKEKRNIFVVTLVFPISTFDKGYNSVTETLKGETELIATLPSAASKPDTLGLDLLVATPMPSTLLAALLAKHPVTDTRVISEAASKPLATGSLKAPALEVIEKKGAGVAGAPPRSRETLRRISNTVRVDIGKLDNIMNIISELGILKSNITRIGAELRNERSFSVHGLELSRAEKFLEKKLAELRDGVLDVRMVPIGQLFGRFDSVVDRLAREFAKEINVTTSGDETELDKRIVEELTDPLMHLIRNTIDHAIESPAERRKLGKPSAGTISLSAFHSANHVVVEIADDGAGIDIELVKAKASEKGLITEDYLGTLSREEALDLIFLPGFTTRDVINETSGRGVGMDVVKENITKLSGIIDIDTTKGKGTSFRLTIPVTLAIIQALIVSAGSERYAVPLNSVIEIIELDQAAVESTEARGVVTAGGRSVPAVRLSTFFGCKGGSPREVYYGIVAGVAEHRLCMIVDSLIEELDVVIKPLSRILNVPGISGATYMGGKGTILVLDVTGILDHTLREKTPVVI
jgi:two-component system chemotaxis sensor kinase CheA